MTSTGIVSQGRYYLVQCQQCGSVLVEQKPSSAEIAELYDELFAGDGYTAYRRALERLKANKSVSIGLLRRMQFLRMERMIEGRDMIEIGGGIGSFGLFAQKRHWSYVDYDVSEQAVEFARELGLEAHVFDADKAPALAAESADCIVMWEVIEHVWNVHADLRYYHQALRPGGVLLLSTPNFRRRGYQQAILEPSPGSPPIHLNFFTTEALKTVLVCAGFDRVKVFGKRIHRPTFTKTGIMRDLRILFGFEPPRTLLAIARKAK
jgi:SAM-dependent methyltransferase